VHVESTRLTRVRALELRPVAFLYVALATTASLFLIVTSGAVVRLTASGLGCDNWPRCGDTPFPEKDFHAIVEFANRALGLVPITLTLVLWLAARRTAGLPRWAVWLALASFVGTIAQAPLGGLTVIFDLHPLLVMAHFVLAMLVLGAAVVVALEAWGLERGRVPSLVPPSVSAVGGVLAVAALVLVVTGTFVTAAGPHSGGADIRRFGDASTAVWIHVRATAAFGLAFLVLLVYAVRHRARVPALFAACLGLLGLLGAQMVVGEVQYRTQLPWWLVLVHVVLAAAVWAAAVALATVLVRPPAPVARGA
jgi:cytochrome c oxidase assembly protein subunit 15